ncbi:hypothetical protein KUCAC02_034371 [Chaenocephalus aceratus]|nr:hypothetical protein KUCAC02_034371 [Chaenocephalus aceratus]
MEIDSQLPPEVWVYILSFLSTEEKHTVRFGCRQLKVLIDQPSLWRNHTVMLCDLRRYTYGFWDMLRHRKLTRVAVRHLRRKEWRRLVKFLRRSARWCSWTEGGNTKGNMENVAHFPGLKVGTSGEERHLGGAHAGVQPHLQAAGAPDSPERVQREAALLRALHPGRGSPGEPAVPAVPPAGGGLRAGHREARALRGLHNLLLSLKKLKHLSWGMRGEPPAPLPDNYLSPSDPESPGETDGPCYLSPSDPESPGETDGPYYLSPSDPESQVRQTVLIT